MIVSNKKKSNALRFFVDKKLFGIFDISPNCRDTGFPKMNMLGMCLFAASIEYTRIN